MGRNLVNFHYFFAHRILFYGVGEPGSLELRIFITGIRKMDSFWDTRFSNFCSEVWGWVGGGRGLRVHIDPPKIVPLTLVKSYTYDAWPRNIVFDARSLYKKSQNSPDAKIFLWNFNYIMFLFGGFAEYFPRIYEWRKIWTGIPSVFKSFFLGNGAEITQQ